MCSGPQSPHGCNDRGSNCPRRICTLKRFVRALSTMGAMTTFVESLVNIDSIVSGDHSSVAPGTGRIAMHVGGDVRSEEVFGINRLLLPFQFFTAWVKLLECRHTIPPEQTQSRAPERAADLNANGVRHLTTHLHNRRPYRHRGWLGESQSIQTSNGVPRQHRRPRHSPTRRTRYRKRNGRGQSAHTHCSAARW
jgi:hypothetical protein